MGNLLCIEQATCLRGLYEIIYDVLVLNFDAVDRYIIEANSAFYIASVNSNYVGVNRIESIPLIFLLNNTDRHVLCRPAQY